MPKPLKWRGVGKCLAAARAMTARPVTRSFCARAGENPGKPASTCGRECQVSLLQPDLDPTSMAEKSVVIPGAPQRKRGRPSKEEATRRALAAILIDPRGVDPLAVLAGIMMDVSAPAGARVSAAKALLAARDPEQPEVSVTSDVAERAIRLLASRKAH
jgi:hypothetical protein